MEYIFLVSGFAILLISGHFLVEGGVSFARHLKISTLVLGATVVAFGTSAPELFVSVQAAINGHPEISIGNVTGSNISNIALVLAFTALILPIPVKPKTIQFNWPVMMVATVLLYVFMIGENPYLSRIEGGIFVVLLIAFTYYSIYASRKNTEDDEEEPPKYSMWLSILLLILSCGGLALGSNFLVDRGAVILAQNWGVEERVISNTIIAIGTSLPELSTSVIAALKKEMDISVGNIVGSNIFNILAVLGITSLVKPIPVNEAVISFDMVWVSGISILLLLFMLPIKRARIGRYKGGFMLLLYISYIYLMFNM